MAPGQVCLHLDEGNVHFIILLKSTVSSFEKEVIVLLCVVTTEAVLHLPVGLSDASPQFGSAAPCPSPDLNAASLSFKQAPDLLNRPGLLVGIDLGAPLHSDGVHSAQVLIFKNIPVLLWQSCSW